MPTKARQKNQVLHTPDGKTVIERIPFNYEYIEYENSVKNAKGNYTVWTHTSHTKVTKFGTYIHPNGGYYVTDAHFGDGLGHCTQYFLGLALSNMHIGLDFQEDNSFDLIPFLTDWDDTIAMFSKKFIKELSYGSITWGVLPFLSDLKSLKGSLEAINDKILTSYQKILGKPVTRRFNIDQSWDDGIFRYKSKTTVSLKGFIDGQILPDTPVSALQVLLDEIGANLDLKVAWDIIPFSFVADYFLPIGDCLESLHPRGWFNPTFTVTGGVSVKMEIEQVAYADGRSGVFEYTYFYRSPGVFNVGSRPTVQPKFEAPSLKGLFNTAYLAYATR